MNEIIELSEEEIEEYEEVPEEESEETHDKKESKENNDHSTRKGAFSKSSGGSLLDGLESVGTINVDSKKEELERLKSEYKTMPMPKKNPVIKRKRYNLNKQIKKLENELKKKEEQTKKEEAKKTDYDDEYERFDNLSEQVKYKHESFKRMTPSQFTKEKLNILSRADRHYTKPAKVITDVLIKMSHITDGYEVIKGYSIDLTEGRDSIETNVKACLIDAGMKGKDMVSSLSNPYLGLGLALSMPLVARYYYNKGDLGDGEKKFAQPIRRTAKVVQPPNQIPINMESNDDNITVGINLL